MNSFICPACVFLSACAGFFLLPGAARGQGVPGDHFADAVVIGPAVPAEHVRLAKAALTLEAGEEEDVTGSHWLTWVCPSAGMYEARGTYPKPSPGSGFTLEGEDPVVKVFTGDVLSLLEQTPYIPLGIVTEPKLFHAETGRRYYFRTGISPYRGLTGVSAQGIYPNFTPTKPGNFTFTLRRLADPPPNDDFANAATVLNEAEETVTGSNAGASNEKTEVLRPYAPGDSVWHRWKAAQAGQYELLVQSPAFLGVEIFSGENLAGLVTEWEGRPNWNNPAMGTVRLRWNVQAGEQRFIRLTGSGYGHQGNYTMRLHRLVPPVNDQLAAATPLPGGFL